MTYYVADADGYLTDIASTRGWHDFITAVKATPACAHAAVFVRDGVVDDPRTLASELGGVKFADVSADSVRRGVVSAAKRAQEVLIISDGVGGSSAPLAKGDKKPCSRCGGLSYNDSRMGLGDCCIDKALPKKDRSGEGGVKKTPSKKASSKQAGKTGKTRYNYPQDKAPESKAKHTPGRPDPVKHHEPTQHRADPQELANQLQIPMATLKSIAERFKDNTKLDGRKGFAKFMMSRLKKVTEKHRLDGDYFGLIYDALVGASPSL